MGQQGLRLDKRSLQILPSKRLPKETEIFIWRLDLPTLPSLNKKNTARFADDTPFVRVKSKYEKVVESLNRAAKDGDDAMVKLHLAADQVNADAKDEDGQTPLIWAAANGHETVVKLLLATGQVNTNSKDSNLGQTSLSLAAEKGHEAV